MFKYLQNKHCFPVDGESTRPRMTRVGSDVGIGNAEICSVTANSSQV